MNKTALKKVCIKCGIDKSLSCFYFRKDQGRYITICFDCKKRDSKDRYLKDRDNRLRRSKKYYQDNKDKKLSYQKYYYQENREEIRKVQSIYRIQNRDRLLRYNRSYYKRNRVALLLQKRNYCRRLGRIRILRNLKYKQSRRHRDPSFKLRESVSRAIHRGIKKAGSNKGGSSCLRYLGYSFAELKKHLELLFEPWMNWDNWGRYDPEKWRDSDKSTWTWQIDHIIPQSKLPFKSMEEENFRICWDLKNLRPLSSKQNLFDGVRRVR